MEQISREARVAKATLYAYFPDKDRVFVAVVEHVIAELEANAVTRAKAEERAIDAASALLLEKFSAEWALVNESTHAKELFAASDGLARAQIEAGQARFVGILAQHLRRAGVTRSQSGPLAEALYYAFDGLVRGSTSARSFDARAKLLLARVLPR